MVSLLWIMVCSIARNCFQLGFGMGWCVESHTGYYELLNCIVNDILLCCFHFACVYILVLYFDMMFVRLLFGTRAVLSYTVVVCIAC